MYGEHLELKRNEEEEEKTTDPIKMLTLQGTSVNTGISVVIECYPHFLYRIQNYIYIYT